MPYDKKLPDDTSFTPKEIIVGEALSLGFSSCGFAKALPLNELRDFYRDFLDNGREITLGYLRRYEKERLDPSRLLPEVKTVITLLFNHYPGACTAGEENFVIARYALGTDKRKRILKGLKKLTGVLSLLYPGSEARIFHDSGPVLEKQWAQRSGSGWIGKHSLLIHPILGSYVSIGLILTSARIDPDPPGYDRCGNCDQCIKACPTGALEEPYRLRIDRCIAYHNIENPGEIPEEFFGKFRNRIYGCDICQEVCPYNRKAIPSEDLSCVIPVNLQTMTRCDWFGLTEEKFTELFRETAVRRIGYPKIMRNIRFAGRDPDQVVSGSSPQR